MDNSIFIITDEGTIDLHWVNSTRGRGSKY